LKYLIKRSIDCEILQLPFQLPEDRLQSDKMIHSSLRNFLGSNYFYASENNLIERKIDITELNNFEVGFCALQTRLPLYQMNCLLSDLDGEIMIRDVSCLSSK
jgi:hypothetical protein